MFKTKNLVHNWRIVYFSFDAALSEHSRSQLTHTFLCSIQLCSRTCSGQQRVQRGLFVFFVFLVAHQTLPTEYWTLLNESAIIGPINGYPNPNIMYCPICSLIFFFCFVVF